MGRRLNLQYTISEIMDVAKNLLPRLDISGEYSKQNLLDLYKEIRNFEHANVIMGLLNDVIDPFFDKFEGKNVQKLNHWGILAKKNQNNYSFLEFIIYIASLKSAELFEISCEITYNYISLNRNLEKSKKEFKNGIIEELSLRLQGTENEGKENNIIKKFPSITSNLKKIGVIKEDKNNYILDYIDVDWRIITLYIYERFLTPTSKSVEFSTLFDKTNFRKLLFIEESNLKLKLSEIQEEGFLKITDTLGLSRIELLFNNIEDVINRIG